MTLQQESPHAGSEVEAASDAPSTGRPRERLLAGLPVRERLLESAGISTVVLEGGEGAPLLLLHGPGESAVNWRWVIPRLVRTHHVVAPDLPAHGSSEAPPGALDVDRVLSWLEGVIARTCATSPSLIGHALGGAIAARFASAHGRRLARLVLVDSLGLGRFRPTPRFAINLAGFMARPSERSYQRFMRQCSFDLESLRERMGDQWEPFVSYNLGRARAPSSKAASRLLREVGMPRIPAEDLARISVPTTLIWGRHDRAFKVRIAEEASERYGWPLHVIENAADDPARDQPEAFLRALHVALGRTVTRRQR